MTDQTVDMRAEILNQARTLFARYGFRKCTTEDISSACGLTKAALYHYFESKNEIFSEVVNRESIILMHDLREAIGARSNPIDKLRAFFLTRFEKIKQLMNLYRISVAQAKELVPVAEEARKRFFEQELRMLEEIFQDGIAGGTFRKIRSSLVARALIAAFKGIEAHFLLHEQAVTVNEAMEEILDVMCYGLETES